jgi:hypothetical protein
MYLYLPPVPQLLFCGFFIDLDDGVPSWTAWLQWLQPLTYAFRLFLMEEFRECGTEIKQNEDLNNCFTQFNAAALNPDSSSGDPADSGFNSLYNESSKLFVAATGDYKGKDDILEYMEGTFVKGEPDFLALLYNDCQVKFKIVNAEAEGNSCSFSAITMRTGDVLPQLAADEFMDSRFVRYTIGYKFFVDLSVDQDPVIDEVRIFFPNTTVDDLFACVSPEKAVESACRVLEDTCPDFFGADGFEDQAQCTAAMSQLPLYEENADGIAAMDSNSTSCRVLYILYAQRLSRSPGSGTG